MTIIITKTELTLATKIGNTVGAKLNLDPEDITAHLNLWLCENYQHVTRYRTLGQDGHNMLTASMKRAAHTYAANELKHQNKIQDQTWYTLEQLKRTLPYIWERHTTTNPEINAELLDNALTILLDIEAAFNQLQDEQRHILAWKYHDQRTYKEIAELLNTNEETARKRTSRALDKLHQILGGDRPYVKRKNHGYGPDK